jgi:uncharacterized protein YecE (DUF72 family)
MGKILTGTASWTDPTLLATDWYPPGATNAEDRLRYYTSQFSLVEVDSTYYGLPSEQTAVLWAERTPEDFTFDFKAFRLFTGHPTTLKVLPKAIRESFSAELQGKSSVYSKDLPAGAVDEIWKMYREALMPVHSAGKLGAIFLQFPKWIFPGRDSFGMLEAARDKLPDYSIAVEFRNPNWFSEKNRQRTFDFLRDQGIAYTSIDGPQGTPASVPPIAEATSDFAVVRFHGRRAETWDKPGVGVQERFKYLYDEDELREWVPKIERLAGETKEVHVLMNNCYADYGVKNAKQLEALLQVAPAGIKAS